MPSRSLKECVAGEPPLCHSVEMFGLEDGTYEVILRRQPQRDEEGGFYLPPDRMIKVFTNRAEAEFQFRTWCNIIKGAEVP